MSTDHVDTTEVSSRVEHTALLLDTDLFFAVKIGDTLKYAGYMTRTVRRLDDFLVRLAERPTIALVNTAARGVDWRAAIRAARDAGVLLVAFGSHVDVETQQQARHEGAAVVISNAKLASDLPGVVARALRRGASLDDAGLDATAQSRER